MKTSLKILTLFLIFVLYSSVAYANIFSDSLRSGTETVFADGAPAVVAYVGIFSNSPDPVSTPSASAIFQKHIGAADHVQWAKQLPGTAKKNFFSSSAWQATRADFLRTYGNNARVNQYLKHQEYLFNKEIRINNKAHFRSNDIKGNLAESLMDDFYTKDGWEIIDGKRGRNGFDGLYVRRTERGTITDWIATDAKSGASKLNMTSRGMQLSQEWVDGNLKDLLAMAEDEYRKSPSAATKQRIADLKQIMKIPGRCPRLYTMKIVSNGDKIQYRILNIDVDGNPVGKPMFVNMNTKNSGAMLKMERAIYERLEKHISAYDPKGAAELVRKIKMAFQKGTIKKDPDLYRFIKREIPDNKLAMAVAQELGEEPPRGSLAGIAGRNIGKNAKIMAGNTILLAAGFIIAHDAMRDGITLETFLKAGLVSIETLAVGIALDYTMNFLVTHTSKCVTEYWLKHTGKRVTEKAIAKLAEELAPGIGRIFGGGLQVLLAGFFIGKSIYDYNKGNITQTDMLVEVGIVSLTTAGTLFFTFTKAGAALGAVLGPGGVVVGTIIGGVGAIASVGYTWYVEQKRQKNLLYEARLRAEWETENNKKRLEERKKELKKEAEALRESAWRGLLPAN